jgi:carboxyl-terminal processing protease
MVRVAWISVMFWGLAEAQQLESFDQVWRTIEEKHWSPEQLEKLPGGGSWKALQGPYRERVAKAGSQQEVREILREMVGKLGKSHYAISGVEQKGTTAVRRGGGTPPGFRVALVEGKVMVTGATAAAAPVKVGWELTAVAGIPMAPALAEIEKQAGASLQASLRRHQMLEGQISGGPGETVGYEFVLPTGVKRRVNIKLPESDGSAGFGFVQGMTVEREFRKVGQGQDVGYFRLGMFLDVVRVLPQFQRAIEQCTQCKGFIVDLRGNPGGVAVMANAMAGWFLQEQDLKLGTMYQRGVELKFVVIPRLNGFTGPLAILVDGASASTSEIFAGGMQALKRARVFGSRTAGAALPSMVEVLPNGDLFQYAVANYVSESGRELEGTGVSPDLEVQHTVAALKAGRDRVLKAAIDWIYANSTVAGLR